MPFTSLGLGPELLAAVNAQNYAEPTPVQARAIPEIIRGADVLALAQTGSGKTAAFGLGLLQRLASARAAAPQQSTPSRRRTPHALVLVPTRELAVQVGDSIRALAQPMGAAVKTSVVFGGVSINPQMLGLRGGTDVVVATPGRLLDLVDQNAMDLSGIQLLVLDEADRLLDLGFADELTRILGLLPKARQSLFFSATFPQSVQALAAELLREPVRIEVAATALTTPDIAQRAIEVDPGRRTQLLRHLIGHHGWTRVLVFVATKFAAEIVADKLRKANINAEPFHGLLSQGKRSQVLADFKASKVSVVVATDLAARGIDIADLPVVVNFDLPRSSVDYLHRIGRTGRAGSAGLGVSFITPEMAAHFNLIEKRHGQVLVREQIAGFEPVMRAEPTPMPQAGAGASASASASAPGSRGPDGVGGIKGKRPSKKDKLRAAAGLKT